MISLLILNNNILLLMRKKILKMPGIEPGAFHMQSERATTALHPLNM